MRMISGGDVHLRVQVEGAGISNRHSASMAAKATSRTSSEACGHCVATACQVVTMYGNRSSDSWLRVADRQHRFNVKRIYAILLRERLSSGFL